MGANLWVRGRNYKNEFPFTDAFLLTGDIQWSVLWDRAALWGRGRALDRAVPSDMII